MIFSFFFSAPKYSISTQEKVVNIAAIERDTFLIVADYRDPFLGTKRRVTGQKTNYKSRTSNNTVASKGKNWPAIAYNGMIKNNNSNKRVGIVKIDGKEYLVKSGDVLGEVKVIKITKQEIKVRFQRESKTITK